MEVNVREISEEEAQASGFVPKPVEKSA